jgi:hypothetical protein
MLHGPVMARPMDWVRRCHSRRLVNRRERRRLVNCWLLIDWRRWGRVSHIGRRIIKGGCSVKAKGRKAEPAAMAPTAMTPATMAPADAPTAVAPTAVAPTAVAPTAVAPAAPTTRDGRVRYQSGKE